MKKDACFVKGQIVLRYNADTKSYDKVPIEKVAVKDKVLSYDQKKCEFFNDRVILVDPHTAYKGHTFTVTIEFG